MPWQGDTNNMIDRFDVRAHLDYIPTYTPVPLLNSTWVLWSYCITCWKLK